MKQIMSGKFCKAGGGERQQKSCNIQALGEFCRTVHPSNAKRKRKVYKKRPHQILVLEKNS